MNNIELQRQMSDAIYKPTAIQQVMFDYMEQNLATTPRIVDASNPYMLLIEAMCATGSAAVDHQVRNLSTRYPALCTSRLELYPHLRADDIHEAFALPTRTSLYLETDYDSILNNSIAATVGNYRYMSIPKDSVVAVDGIKFLIENTYELRLYESGLKVVMLADGEDITGNVVTYYTTKSIDGYKWIGWSIPVRQLTKTKRVVDVSSSVRFSKTLDYTGQLAWIKASYTDNGVTYDLPVSLSPDNYREDTPELVAVVKDYQIDFSISSAHTVNGSLGTDITIEIYTTLGDISGTLSTYSSDEFTMSLVNSSGTLSASDKAFNKTSFRIASDDSLLSGRHALSFTELKENVVNRTQASQVFPIIPDKMTTYAESLGYQSLKVSDTLAGRLYVCGTHQPIGEDLPYRSELAASHIELRSSISELGNLDTAVSNVNQVTLLPTTVYSLEEMAVSIVPSVTITMWEQGAQANFIQALNSHDFRYSPWFYVYSNDTGRIISEAYELDRPTLTLPSHEMHNVSTDRYMNTEDVSIVYRELGYDITVRIIPDKTISTLLPSEIFSQLSFDDGIGNRHYIESHATALVDDYLTSYIRIESNLELYTDKLIVTNALDYAGNITPCELLLSGKVYITHGTLTASAGYQSDPIEAYVNVSNSSSQRYSVNMESYWLTLGIHLNGLWRDVRPNGQSVEYQRSTVDVPMTYTTTVVEDGPTGLPFTLNTDNCTISINTIHQPGDPVLDAGGSPMYQYRAGDLILDEYGLPVPVSVTDNAYRMDIMVFPLVYRYVKNTLAISDVKAVRNNILSKSTTELAPIQARLLSLTEAYYKPISGLGMVRINLGNGDYQWVPKAITEEIDVYTSTDVSVSPESLAKIKLAIVNAINVVLQQTTVSYRALTAVLEEQYTRSEVSIVFHGDLFSPGQIYQIVDSGHRRSIRKLAAVNDYGKLTMVDAITFNFKSI